MGLLRLQPLRGCASGGIEYAWYHRAAGLWGELHNIPGHNRNMGVFDTLLRYAGQL